MFSWLIHPWMAAGTAMGSAPVIIHLLNRQRYKRITWAAMHWLLASFKKSARRLKIEELILLLVRILILVLLALALARPHLKQGGGLLGGRSHVHRIILLDTSFSMDYSHGGKTSFERAKEIARHLTSTGSLSSGDQVTMIHVTDQAEASVRASTNLSAVYREADGAETSHAATDLVKAMTRAFELLDESDHPRKEIFLITDMGLCGWIDPRAAGAARLRGIEGLKKAVAAYRKKHPDRGPPPIFLVNVGAEEPKNLAIVKLTADTGTVAAKRDVQFRAEVANFTDQDRDELSVALEVDGQRVASRILAVKSGERKTAHFPHRFETPGPHWVTARVEGDHLATDNRRHLAVPVVDSLKVLAVDGDENLSSPIESETGLLIRAISPQMPGFMVEQGQVSPFIVSARVIPESALSEVQFEGNDLVILANVPLVPEEKLPQLRRFVREGGGLLIFVGDRVGPEDYNETLYGEEDPLLPARLDRWEGEAGNPDAVRFWNFQPDDATGAVLPVFSKQELWPLAWKVRIFKRYLCLPEETEEEEELPPDAGAEETPEEDGDKADEDEEADPAEEPENGEAAKAEEKKQSERKRVIVPLKYNDGQPAILIREYGMGKVALVTTTADKHWNNLPAHLAHLPMMNDLVHYLVHERGSRHNLTVGGTFSLRWPSEDLLKEVSVGPPEGHEEDKRTIKPTPPDAGKAVVLSCPDARWAGPYTLTVVGEGEPRDRFVVNVDPTESDLTPMPPEELRKRLKKHIPELDFTEVNDREKIDLAIKTKSAGREFWWGLAMAVLALAVVETFLAWLFGRHRW